MARKVGPRYPLGWEGRLASVRPKCTRSCFLLHPCWAWLRRLLQRFPWVAAASAGLARAAFERLDYKP